MNRTEVLDLLIDACFPDGLEREAIARAEDVLKSNTPEQINDTVIIKKMELLLWKVATDLHVVKRDAQQRAVDRIADAVEVTLGCSTL